MDFEDNGQGLLVPSHKLLVKGQYTGQLIRAGKIIDEWTDDNLVVNEGLNSLLNVQLGAGTQIGTWYLGLFQGNYTPVATDTASVIAANSTEASGYTAGARQPWVQAGASGQSITNTASRASFTFNYVSATSIYGAFLVSTATINGTSGTLFSAARFSTAKSVINLDQLLLTYTFTASSV